jgi:CheY-like chemotaxis protein
VDRGQVEQILLNLSLNSRDAMPEGGRLILETRRADLDADYCAAHPETQPGPHAVLAVSDTGIGMTPEVRRRAFEPFFTTKEVGKGTGLGLSSVYGIVKQSGGFVTLYSEPGHGTSMRIYFPEADTQARPESAAAPAPSFRGSEAVLLVEDEEAVRGFAAQALEVQGYTVFQAANGHEALDILERGSGAISLVITDVVMPDMGGQVLADRLRALFPGLPVLFISGYTESAVIHSGLKDRAGAFLSKPFGPSDLARAVREALDGKALAQGMTARRESE